MTWPAAVSGRTQSPSVSDSRMASSGWLWWPRQFAWSRSPTGFADCGDGSTPVANLLLQTDAPQSAMVQPPDEQAVQDEGQPGYCTRALVKWADLPRHSMGFLRPPISTRLLDDSLRWPCACSPSRQKPTAQAPRFSIAIDILVALFLGLGRGPFRTRIGVMSHMRDRFRSAQWSPCSTTPPTRPPSPTRA